MHEELDRVNGGDMRGGVGGEEGEGRKKCKGGEIGKFCAREAPAARRRGRGRGLPPRPPPHQIYLQCCLQIFSNVYRRVEVIGVLRHMQQYFSHICDGTDVQAD